MNLKESESEEKLRGGYYTPPEIARFIVEWGMEKDPRTVLEPSCGDGAFIDALDHYVDDMEGVSFHGVELDSREAAKARKKFSGLAEKGCSGTGVTRAEFFEFASKKRRHTLKGGLDLVIGNPPYIRYQYFEKGRELAERRLEELGIRTTRHSNSWLHFLAECVSLMSEDSRIGMVIPGELLDVSYSSDLRRWLTEQLTSITVVTFEKLVFPGVQQEVVVFLGEKSSRSKKSTVRLVQLEDASELSAWTVKNGSRRAPRAIGGRDKWTCYFLDKQDLEFYTEIERSSGARRFSELADVDIGIVTGANNFFCVSDEVVRGARFRNAKKQLDVLPMLSRDAKERGLEYTEEEFLENSKRGKRCHMLRFHKDSRMGRMPEKIRSYLRGGESEGLHLRYKCRIREPWYWIPSVHSTELCMFKRASEYTRLIHNPDGAYTTDTIYRIECLENDEGIGARHLAFSFVNSLTFLSCELEGRSYGGGVLELVPSEVERVLLPVHKCTEEEFSALDRMLREGRGIDEILDYTDARILSEQMNEAEIARVRSCWRVLQKRREVRGRSKKSG
jgi:adenine-specific DNA-methyltransferase